MAYIRKYRDGWRAEVQRHGCRATFTHAKKAQVQKWALAKEAELDDVKQKRGDLLSAAIKRYLETVSPTKGAGAKVWEGHRFAAMQGYFGNDAVLADIDTRCIGEWRDHRLKTVSGSTVRRESNLLRNLFTVAADEWKWIDGNPFKGVRLPKHNPARKAIWGWREIRRVLRAPVAGKTLQTVQAFHIALCSGMRLNEALAARMEGRLAVLPKDKSTQDQAVKVPLTRQGRKVMAKYGRFSVGANEASALFSRLLDDLAEPVPYGRPAKGTMAGVGGLTFHDARATALTLLSRKVDVLTLARISRHRDLKILQNTYYRETAEQIAARL